VLLYQVPVLVQSQLADQADDLVRVITRQWAVHQRMTAAPAAAGSTSNLAAGSSSSSSRQQSAAEGSRRITAVPQQAPEAAAGASSSPVVTVTGAAMKSARRINPVPVDNAGDAARLVTSLVADSSSSVVSGVGVGGECVDAAGACGPQVEAETAAVTTDDDAAPPADAAVASAAAEAASPAGADNASIVESLLGLCISSSSSSSSNAARCISAGVSQEYKDLQHAVAVAVGQRRLDQAIDSYVAAAAVMLPGGLPGDELIASSSNSSNCAAAAAWKQVVGAAVCAADVLVAGMAAGCYTASELEQVLLLQSGDAAQAGAPVAAPHAATAAGSKQAAAQQSRCGSAESLQQQQLCQLLAGAVLHSLLTSSQQKLAVWVGHSDATLHFANDSSSMPYFVRLPAALMKVARADGPLWLLQQLRTWLQAATLGGDTASGC
jgi:hypothetical protein